MLDQEVHKIGFHLTELTIYTHHSCFQMQRAAPSGRGTPHLLFVLHSLPHSSGWSCWPTPTGWRERVTSKASWTEDASHRAGTPTSLLLSIQSIYLCRCHHLQTPHKEPISTARLYIIAANWFDAIYQFAGHCHAQTLLLMQQSIYHRNQ